MKVFLSHSGTDTEIARKLSLDLKAANVDVWLDQWEIGVGEEFVQKIERGLEEAQFVIVLLTKASVASAWVSREWRQKAEGEQQTKCIAVVPVRCEACEIPDFLAQRSHADIMGGSYQMGLRQLLTLLRYYSDETSIAGPDGPIVAPNADMIQIVTPIGLEVGRALIPLIEPDSEGSSRFIDELAPRMREALQAELGFPFPGIRVRGNETDMPPCSALILIDEIPELYLREVSPDDVLVDATIEALAERGIRAELRDDPAAGRAWARIDALDRGVAEAAGFATWDAAEYLLVMLQAVLRRLASSFLDVDVAKRLVDLVESTAPELVAETVPKAVSWFELTDVLQRLVDEEISVGDMGRILTALSQRKPEVRDTVILAEEVRHALSSQIAAKFLGGRDALPVLLLDPGIEALISGAIGHTAIGAYLDLELEHSQNILTAIRELMSSLGSRAAGVPMLLTEVAVRRFMRKLVNIEFPSLHVLARQDVEASTAIQVVGHIRLQLTADDTLVSGEGVPG